MCQKGINEKKMVIDSEITPQSHHKKSGCRCLISSEKTTQENSEKSWRRRSLSTIGGAIIPLHPENSKKYQVYLLVIV